MAFSWNEDAEGAEIGEGAAFGRREGEMGAEFGGEGGDVAVEKGGIGCEVAGALGGSAAGGAPGEGAGGEAEFLRKGAGERGLGEVGGEEGSDLAAEGGNEGEEGGILSEGGGWRVHEEPFEGDGGGNGQGLSQAVGEEFVPHRGGVGEGGKGFGEEGAEAASAAGDGFVVGGAERADGVEGGQVYEFGSNDERLADRPRSGRPCGGDFGGGGGTEDGGGLENQSTPSKFSLAVNKLAMLNKTAHMA